MIEDSPAGIVAARSAGMSVIALITTPDGDELGNVDMLLPDLAGIEVRGSDRVVPSPFPRRWVSMLIRYGEVDLTATSTAVGEGRPPAS